MNTTDVLAELDALDARIRGENESDAMAALSRKAEVLADHPNVRRKRAAARERIRSQRKAALEHERRAAYEAYINGDEWKRRRAIAIRKAGRRCQVCNQGGDQLHVHHRTYERFGAEMEDDLTVLCASCHDLYHRAGRIRESEAAA